jgi:nicotinamide-nucleotide amidase
VAEREEAVRGRLGDVVFGADGGGLENCVVGMLKSRGFTLALAESVTGGLLAGRLSSVPGASGVLRGGWVAYQEAAKMEWLGIPAGLLEAEGAVSEKTALAMAKAAREKGRADVGLSTTGWAGPGGGTPTDPVGTVFMAVATSAGAEARRMVFRGGRDNIRNFAVMAALTFLRGRLA